MASSKALQAFALCVYLGAATAGWALETDPYSAWGRDLTESAPAVNARVELGLRDLLMTLEARETAPTCDQARDWVAKQFRFLLVHPVELWVNNSRWIDRVPKGREEEVAFRKRFIYRNFNLFPMSEFMPPSPTIRLNAVHVGTDKIAHFFSEGHLYLKRYRKARRAGASHEDAERAAIAWGVRSERGILGQGVSGIFSRADLEANHAGMRFLLDLCVDSLREPASSEAPLWEFRDGRWSQLRAFDFRRYVTPEWDESFQNSIPTRSAWKRLKVTLAEYCPLLRSDWVQQQKGAYRKRGSQTATERYLTERIDAGKLKAPSGFTLEALCAKNEVESRDAAQRSGENPRGR